MIKYISTRGGGTPENFEHVLLTGLAPDGGLYVPETWPALDIKSLAGKSYAEIAEAVMYPFVEGCIDRADLRTMIEETYGSDIFRHKDVVPLHKPYSTRDLYVCELFHGPTIAFKDVALQLLGRLFDHVLKKRGERVTIVGATSGDTGSAAIEGVRHSDHTDIFILFPDGRVSDVQRRQMTTVKAENVHNIALKGTFDDCQSTVKEMFGDEKFRDEMNLSAVNSINWARIMAQIVYYVSTAVALGAPDKKVKFVVPTGNFGNVLAGYAARKMGVPLELVIATNRNDILTRFFETGEMKAGEVHPTMSPSMDIQISSNFERYLFDLLGRDAKKLNAYMSAFKETGSFSVEKEDHEKAVQDFDAFRTSETETTQTIEKIYKDTGYIIDPHTAVALCGALDIEEDARGPVVVMATAHAAKFPDAIEKAIGQRPDLPDHLSDLYQREEFFVPLPNDVEAVKNLIRENVKSADEAA